MAFLLGAIVVRDYWALAYNFALNVCCQILCHILGDGGGLLIWFVARYTGAY